MTLTKEAKQEIIGKHGRARGRHRLAEVQIALLTRADQPAHRASADAHEGSLLAPRAAQARRPPPPVPELPAAEGSRGLPRPDQGARPAAINPGRQPEGGSLSERLADGRFDSNLHPPRRSGGHDEHRSDRARPESRSRSAGRRSPSRRASSPSRPTAPSSSARATRWCSRRPQGRMEAREGADFFPLTVDVEERMYAAGQDPRRLLQARGTPDRARDPDRADDRPPDPAALAEGLPERGAGDLHRALGRHGHPARHPLHQRRLGGADDLAAAVHRPGRRRPDRPIDGELVVNPTLQEIGGEPRST